MATAWIDITSSAFYGDANGYIRYANQLFKNDGALTSTSGNAMSIFNISENTRYRVTMQMRNRFRLGCLATLTTGQTVTNYVFDPLDINDATDQGGAERSLEITSGAGQVYLIVGAWSTGISGTAADVLSTIIVEEQRTAYTVTFEDWDGTVLKTEQVEQGGSATAPANPTRSGYNFTGWDVPFSNITADTTVTAEYEAAIVYHTVIFEDWNGTALKTEQVAHGGAATAPASPTRSGYCFIGWNGAFDNITADTTIIAQYVQIVYYTVTFMDWNSTVLKTEQVEQGNAATAPADPTRSGYRFTGWDAPFSNITADTTVTAQYEQFICYTVTFEDWDGTVLKTEQVEQGSAATAPADPTRSGYTFTGWDVPFSDITADTTITAQYVQTIYYTVTFVDWDGTVLKTQQVAQGSAATAPPVPSRIGYTFRGWNARFNNIQTDTYLTALYAEIIIYYRVTFQNWNGTALKSQQVQQGNAATAPADPTRNGYTFIGWDVPFTCIMADTLVTAVFVQDITTYTVTFKDWDGTVLKTEQVEQGGTATAPADPTREGYTFTGWSSAFSNVQSDLIITAQYTRIIIYHTVCFRDWDADLLMAGQVEDGTAALPPLPPLRVGFIFDHWDSDFSNVTADMTVTAVYRVALTHSVIKIYSSLYSLVQTVEKVLTANYRESLDGELTLSFSTLAGRAESIDVGCIAEYKGCYFNIVRVEKSISSGVMVMAVTCEHISYVLNDDNYKIDSFDFTGLPSEGLTLLLEGTQFTAGTVDFTEETTMQINTSVTRREALMQFIAILGGEIEYSGHTIGIREHRGDTIARELMESKNVTDISVTHDSRSATASYTVAFHKAADFEIGDEVHIVFAPLGVDTYTRIVTMEYNPFYCYSIKVEVGDYVPTINESLFRIEQAATAQGEDMSAILGAFDDFESDYSDFQTDYENFLSTAREVQNISVGASQFSVAFTDGTTSTYNYTVDAEGRMTSITKVMS